MGRRPHRSGYICTALTAGSTFFVEGSDRLPGRECAVQRFGSSRGCETHPATWSFQPESSRSGGGGNETVKAFGDKGSLWRLSELASRNVSEHRAGPENGSDRSRPSFRKGRPQPGERVNDSLPPGPVGVVVTASSKGKIRATRETPRGDRACDQLATREGQARPRGVADGSVLP